MRQAEIETFNKQLISDEVQEDRLKGGSNSYVFLSLFLALYLLLLAVFILLNSISEIDTRKKTLVTDSVREAFRDAGGENVVENATDTEADEKRRTQAFLREVETAFASAIQVQSLKFTPSGERMKVSATTSQFFREGELTLNPDVEPVLNRIADSLAQRNDEELRYEMALMVGTGGRLPGGEDLSRDFEIRRAGNFAQRLRQMGVPSDSIRIGVRAADPNQIEIHFFVRRKSLAQISFEGIGGTNP